VGENACVLSMLSMYKTYGWCGEGSGPLTTGHASTRAGGSSNSCPAPPPVKVFNEDWARGPPLKKQKKHMNGNSTIAFNSLASLEKKISLRTYYGLRH
jgi:hypothetical protein